MDNDKVTDNEQESIETWRLYREAARAEYEYAHVSSNRLDNKVYILLAVCAFLFPVLYSVRIETADFMSLWPEYILTAIRFMPLICLSVAIVLLLCAVKTIRIARIDPESAIREGKNTHESLFQAEHRFAWAYAFSRNAVKDEQNRKYAVADKALILIIISVCLFVFAVIQQGYKEISKGGEVKVPIDYSREISKEDAAKMTADELLEYAIKTGKAPPRMPTTRELMQSKYFIFPGVNRKD